MVEATRRRQIENVASTLFRENGYAATSVRDIARALDLQGASLYSHVASKEEVLWSIVDRASSAFERRADQGVAPLGAVGARDRVAALVRGHVLVVAQDPEQASVFVREWRHLSSERREAILARRDAYEGRLRALIADGMATGDFAIVDPALATTFLLTAMNGICGWYRPGGRLSPEQLADAYVDLALRSLTEDYR